jgi:HSP20 family protein
MSSLMRWSPRRDVLTMSEAMDRLFNDAFLMPGNGGQAFGPKVDVIENEKEIVVKAELPGFKPDNVDIRLEGNVLTLRGQVEEETEEGEGQYHVKERRMRSFTRTLQLPVAVDANKASADFDNGVLNLTLPKDEAALPKRINITPKNENGKK